MLLGIFAINGQVKSWREGVGIDQIVVRYTVRSFNDSDCVEHLKRMKVIHQRDLADGYGRLVMPML